MRFRFQMLLFAVLALSGAILLWIFSPTYEISSHGIESSNRYWGWLAGVYFVGVGCALEYFWQAGSDHISHRLPEV